MNKLAGKIAKTKRFEMPAISESDLQPRSDMTFKVLDGLTLDGNDLEQSLLNGCLVRNCTFHRVRFSRCDLEQIQIQNCDFVDVNFENIELNSAKIDKSRFERCRFDDALISDCRWRECSIDNCSFKKAVLHVSHFENCRIEKSELRGASIQLNVFRQTAFESMTLGDCTFLNHLMIECSYKDVQINAESIGSIFGISEKDLLSLRLVYLGQPVVGVAATQGLLDALEKEYTQRRWFFMREMLRLNFHRTPIIVGLTACFEALLWPASLGAPLKAGDITFMETVVLELFRRRELPALAALSFPDRIKDDKLGEGGLRFAPEQELKLQQLVNQLKELFWEMLEELKVSIEPFSPENDKIVTAKLIFDSKPRLDMLEFMNDLASLSALNTKGKTVMLQESFGSYLLILETSLTTLAALQIALWLLNGCVAQIIELKGRLKVVSRKQLPKVIQDRVLLPDQTVPKWMGMAVQSIFSKLFAETGQFEQIASDLQAKNLRRIEISPKKHTR